MEAKETTNTNNNTQNDSEVYNPYYGIGDREERPLRPAEINLLNRWKWSQLPDVRRGFGIFNAMNFTGQNSIDECARLGIGGDPWVEMKAEMEGKSMRVLGFQSLARKNPIPQMNQVPLEMQFETQWKYPLGLEKCTIM